MSALNLEDDIVLEYLAECREHLTTIETDLLSMEQAGAAIDEQLVNRVFRAAHSIKGGAGFFDLLKIKELGASDRERAGSGALAPDDSEFRDCEHPAAGLRQAAQPDSGALPTSNDADISEFTDALGRLAEAASAVRNKSARPQETVTIRFRTRSAGSPARLLTWQQARRGGKFVYVIEYDLIHDIQRRGKTPLEVLNQLMKCGDILTTEFDLDSAGTLEQEPSNALLLDVLYSTALDAVLAQPDPGYATGADASDRARPGRGEHAPQPARDVKPDGGCAGGRRPPQPAAHAQPGSRAAETRCSRPGHAGWRRPPCG